MSIPAVKTRLPLTRSIWGWALYDFANSAFSTTIMSVVFSVYYATALARDGVTVLGISVPGESLWGYLVSLVMAVTILIAPSLGALADHRQAKRRFLIFSTVLGAGATMALFTAKPGLLLWSTALAFLAIAGFELAQVFYNAFLNDIAAESQAGRVSGFGFALGYIGGGLCLALNLWMIYALKRADDGTWSIRFAIASAGAWWLLFSLPMFHWVRDRPLAAEPEELVSAARVMGRSLKQLGRTLKSAWSLHEVKWFLAAYLVFNDGIQTIILMASIFGAKQLGMSSIQLGLSFLMVQFVAFFGAMIFGRIADAWSHRNAILVTLAVYIAVTFWAIFMTTAAEYWVMAGIVGLILGGSQAAARSLYSLLIPAERAGEFFALYAVVGKAAALLGPVTFGLASQFWGIRAGIGSLLVFFVVGSALLFNVNERRGVSSRQIR